MRSAVYARHVRTKMAVHVRKLTLFGLTLLWLTERSTDCSTNRFKLPGVWNTAGAKLMTKLQLLRATVFANKRGTNWKHQLLRKPWLFSIGLLLLCGDTHPNPGPTTAPRYPCVSCNDEVIDQGICCDGCQRWCHPKCAFVSDEEYLRLGSCSDTWLCPTCCLPSFTSSLLDLSDHTVSEGHDANLPNYPNSVSVTHLNARSLLPHMDEISLLATNHLIDVITLSETWLDETWLDETWLDETVSDAEVSLPGYSLLRNDRNQHGGGVATLISTSIKFVPRPDLKSSPIETLWIEIFPRSKRSTLICCAYRPPSHSGFFNDLLNECDLALSANKRIAILGDLNCNLMDSSLPTTKLLTSFCNQLNLVELVCAPTRVTETSISQLDVILTNDPGYFHQTLAIPSSTSDHHLILTYLRPRGLKTPQPPKYIKTRNYNKLNTDLLYDLMNDESLKCITDISDLDKCVEEFTTYTTAVMNRVVPEKALRVKLNSSPWARQPEVREARIKRDLAHRKALKHSTPEAWCNYRALRNKATAVLRDAKASYYHHLAEETRRKPYKFWKEFRHLSNKSAPASAPLSSHSADDFNHHFLTVAPQIVQQIPLTQNLDPISYLSLQHQDPVPDLEIITVEEETVHDLLCTLDHRTATGHDGIPPKFLKLCGPLISRLDSGRGPLCD